MITNAAFEAGVARTVVARPVKLHRTQIHTSIVTCVECGGGGGERGGWARQKRKILAKPKHLKDKLRNAVFPVDRGNGKIFCL